MPDPIFENPRLVSIYDAFDGERTDLIHYIALAKELGAKSVLDVGSGTGCLALLLAEQGFEVIGLEPAKASLELARSKPNSERIQWILGDSSRLPTMAVDLALMTGNVAQVFLTDEDWMGNLVHLRKVLKPSGHLIFEVRDPSKKAWLEWTREKTQQIVDIPNVGKVESWCQVTNVENGRVSFRWTYVFAADNQVITSDSVLRFRKQEEIEQSLKTAGFTILEVRDALDRPGKEFVFIAIAP